MKDKLKKVVKSKYFLFAIVSLLVFTYLFSKDVILGSGDAYETVKVVKSFFTDNIYGSYVMYKGIYAFVLEFLSYKIGLLFNISEFLFLKLVKALMFSYIVTLGIPCLIKSLFKYEPKKWQIIIFSFITFLLERGVITLLSVDLLSFFIFLISLNLISNYFKNEKKYKLFLIGLFLGISSCLSGQYTISTLIIIVYLIINIIIKYKKDISKCLMLLLILIIGISITKGCDTIFKDTIVKDAIEKGYWIPDGEAWIIHGLSNNIKTITYPSELTDNLSLSLVSKDNYSNYENLISGVDVYNYKSYFKLIIQYPIVFIVRWTERLFLGLVADPLNAYPISYNNIYVIVSYMSVCLYVLWYYIKKNLKKINQLFNKQSIIFYAFLFLVLVPTFGHVENRYYFAGRVMLNGILLLSPLLNEFIEKIKSKDIKFTNINMNFITCIVFVIICLTAYCALYQSSGIDVKYIEALFKL